MSQKCLSEVYNRKIMPLLKELRVLREYVMGDMSVLT